MARRAQREASVAQYLAPPLKLRRHAVGGGEYVFIMGIDREEIFRKDLGYSPDYLLNAIVPFFL